MRAVGIGLFEHLCEELIDEVVRSGEPIIITRDGSSIAQLLPVKTGRRTLWGVHKGQIEIVSDIVAAVDLERDVDR